MSKSPCCVFFILLLSSGLFTFSCFASELKQEYPGLAMHGEHYLNSCSPASREVLRKKLLGHHVDDPEQVWKVITAILFPPNDAKNRAHVKQFVHKRIRFTSESTGEKPDVQTIELSDELIEEIIAAGKAWEVSLRMESGRIFMHYFANEACVKGATLSFHAGKWSIYEFGVVCD